MRKTKNFAISGKYKRFKAIGVLVATMGLLFPIMAAFSETEDIRVNLFGFVWLIALIVIGNSRYGRIWWRMLVRSQKILGWV